MHSSTAFVDVTTVPMDRPEARHHQTVLIESDRIVTVGAVDNIAVPIGCQVVDGAGRYLMPGLADMHIHLAFRDPDPRHLVLYLAEGTTTVRSLSGTPHNATWRDQVASGELVGPTILTAGQTLIGGIEGAPDYLASLPIVQPESAADAAAEVRRQGAAGWPDLIKVYDGLAPDVYIASIEAAVEAGIYVAGHLLDELPLEKILAAGLDEVAHIDELNFRHWRGEPGDPDFTLDHGVIPETAALLAAERVAVVSNISADEVMAAMIFDTAGVLDRPEYRVVRPEMLRFWATEGRQLRAFAAQGPYRRDLELPFFRELVAAIDAAGATVLVGTDTSRFMEGTVPSQIHRELEILVEAGLSPFAALAAATRNAAEVVTRMGRDGQFGTIAPGQRADLILLDGNPLDDVSHTRSRVGVMAAGNYFEQSALDAMVAEFVSTYHQEEAL